MLKELSKKDARWREIAFTFCKDKQLADDIVQDMYAHVFALQYDVRTFCDNCTGTGKILKKIDEHLEIVYNENIEP